MPLDWRNTPVLEALSLGVASIEADVWLINGTLFVSLVILLSEMYLMACS